MNRSNVGNVITNGIQVLSVAATTYGKMQSAAERLNARSSAENDYDDGGDTGENDVTPKPKRSNNVQKRETFYEPNSEQIANILSKVNNDMSYTQRRSNLITTDLENEFIKIKGENKNANV